MSAEDAKDDTLRPRLDRAGAEVGRIHVLDGVRVGGAERPVSLLDVGVIEEAVVKTGCRLVIVDPLSAYLGGTDSHRDADVRGVLSPLAALAERRDLALICVMHLNKAAGQRALYRAGGSIAFTAAARIVLAVAADPDQEGRRILAPVKSNLAAPAAPLAYRLTDGRVEWEDGPLPTLDVDALLSPAATMREDRSEADALIVELLSGESWPMRATDAIKAGESQGIHAQSLRRAARKAGVKIRKAEGFGAAGGYLWHRPIDNSIPDAKASNETVSSMGGLSSMELHADSDASTPAGGRSAVNDDNPTRRAFRSAESDGDGDARF